MLIKCNNGVIYPLNGVYHCKISNRGNVFSFTEIGDFITIKKQCKKNFFTYPFLEFPKTTKIINTDVSVVDELGTLASRGHKVASLNDSCLR